MLLAKQHAYIFVYKAEGAPCPERIGMYHKSKGVELSEKREGAVI